ncbi:hypothetical protein [Legionella sp. WA2022007384]
MGNSYKDIYTTLGSRSKVQQLHRDESFSDLNTLKLSYLNEAFAVYCARKYPNHPAEQIPKHPTSLKAYQSFTKNNPDFINYNRAALLLYQEKLDAMVVESRKDAALAEACKLALTSLISKNIIKIN